MTDPTKKFLIVAMIITLALSGWSFAKSESATHHVGQLVNKQGAAAVQQAKDREAAVQKNAEARKEDCENNNKVREALRENVEQGKKEQGLLLTLLPSLNTKQVLVISNHNERRELKAFAPLNCLEYAHRALPPAEANKITLAEQQAELHHLIVESITARQITVKQRCELTGLLVSTTQRFKLPESQKYAKSYAECVVQLHHVEKLASEAK